MSRSPQYPHLSLLSFRQALSIRFFSAQTMPNQPQGLLQIPPGREPWRRTYRSPPGYSFGRAFVRVLAAQESENLTENRVNDLLGLLLGVAVLDQGDPVGSLPSIQLLTQSLLEIQPANGNRLDLGNVKLSHFRPPYFLIQTEPVIHSDSTNHTIYIANAMPIYRIFHNSLSYIKLKLRAIMSPIMAMFPF